MHGGPARPQSNAHTRHSPGCTPTQPVAPTAVACATVVPASDPTVTPAATETAADTPVKSTSVKPTTQPHNHHTTPRVPCPGFQPPSDRAPTRLKPRRSRPRTLEPPHDRAQSPRHRERPDRRDPRRAVGSSSSAGKHENADVQREAAEPPGLGARADGAPAIGAPEDGAPVVGAPPMTARPMSARLEPAPAALVDRLDLARAHPEPEKAHAQADVNAPAGRHRGKNAGA